MKRFYAFSAVLLFMSGTLLSQSWHNNYNGTGNREDESRSVCSDDSGNVYVTGFSLGLSSGYDIVTIKYGSDGSIIWTRIFNGTGNGSDRAFGIVQDDLGYLYVVGYTTSSGENEDVLLLRYNSAGTLIWTRTFNHSNNSSDQAFGIVVDNSDRTYIYLAGTTRSGSNYDYLTIKYRDDGTLKWSNTYSGGAGTEDKAIGIVVDTDGNPVVTGTSLGVTSSYDYCTIKYNSEGAQLWTKRFNGNGNTEDRAFGIVSDRVNNITVTGCSIRNSLSETSDVATVQYDENGNITWTKIYNGPENSEDNAFGIVVDNLDNIYVAGSTLRAGTSSDFLVIKYNRLGTQQWTSEFNTGGSNFDAAYCLKTDDEGDNIYLAGSSNVSGSEKISVAKFSSLGLLQQYIIYPGHGRAVSLDLNNANNLYLSGYYYDEALNSSSPNKDYITMEFTGGSIVITALNSNNEVPRDFSLHQNYPNPFNPSTTIRFDLPSSSYVRLIVYDISGREAAVLVDNEMRSGIYEVSFNASYFASGVYFCKLFADDRQFIRKMILVK